MHQNDTAGNKIFLLAGVEVYIMKIFASCSFAYIYKKQLS